MVRTTPKTRAFLNEATIEGAFESYMDSYKKLPSVRAAWERKPTLAAFKKRFGKDWEKRQRTLDRKHDPVLRAKDNDDVTSAVHTLLEALQGISSSVDDVDEDDVDDDEDDVDVDPTDFESLDEARAFVDRLLNSDAAVSDDDEDDEPIKRQVKPENVDALPSKDQFYFLCHRAIEAGEAFVVVPVKRGPTAEFIGHIKDGGLDYAKALRKVKRAS